MSDVCTCRPESYPFFCPRQQCEKNHHWHVVCHHHPHWHPKDSIELEVVEEHFEYLDETDPPAVAVSTPQRNPSPTFFQQVWNLATSLADFVADGCETVSSEQYEQRLQVCQTCPERVDNRCNACGCWLNVKARGRAFACPLNKWPNISDSTPSSNLASPSLPSSLSPASGERAGVRGPSLAPESATLPHSSPANSS